MSLSASRFIAQLTVMALTGTVGSLAATCTAVHGQIQETAVISGCTSLFGLCTVSQISGNITGVGQFTATNILPVPNTPFVIISGDISATNVQLDTKHGTITLKSTAAYNTATGDIVDYEVITGGTEDFEKATGALRVTGTFLNGTGTSHFIGTVCVP